MEIQQLHERFTEAEFVVQYKGEDEAEDSGDYNNGNSPYDCIVQYKFEGRTSENFGKVIKSAEALDKAGLTYLTHRSTENFEDRK